MINYLMPVVVESMDCSIYNSGSYYVDCVKSSVRLPSVAILINFTKMFVTRGAIHVYSSQWLTIEIVTSRARDVVRSHVISIKWHIKLLLKITHVYSVATYSKLQ